jgi:hypothetical protein
MWRDGVKVDFKVLYPHFFGGAEENHKTFSQKRHPMGRVLNSKPLQRDMEVVNHSGAISVLNELALLETNNCMTV